MMSISTRWLGPGPTLAVAGDDDERVWVGGVPYTLFGREFSWREGEIDGGGKGQEEEGSGEHWQSVLSRLTYSTR
jgi:hypothetical protein